MCKSLIKEDFGAIGSKLVGLQRKGALPGESFIISISKNWLNLGKPVSPRSPMSKHQKHMVNGLGHKVNKYRNSLNLGQATEQSIPQ